MAIDLILHEGEMYPKFQSEGFAAKFAIPFAQEVCKGRGVDVGCGKEAWALPGAMMVDPAVMPGNGDAMNFPKDCDYLDYIFSSHCLEHLDHWVETLDYWHSKLRRGGVLFLYLPDFSQTYWRPWFNRKHRHVFTPEIIDAYMRQNFVKVMTSGVDLNNSFIVMGEK